MKTAIPTTTTTTTTATTSIVRVHDLALCAAITALAVLCLLFVATATARADDVIIIDPIGRDPGTGTGPVYRSVPEYVRVRGIAYAGSGCPAGSVAVNIAPDHQAFVFLFDQLVATAGPGVPRAESRKNCQINFDLDFPQGWQYTVSSVEWRGYVSLESRVTALLQTRYYFQGQSQTASLRTTFAGPIDQYFSLRDTLGLAAVVWSPCGAQRSLNVNVEARVSNLSAPDAAGLLAVDPIDGLLRQPMTFRWRRC